MSDPALPPVVAVVGATAAGKSELALQLAQRLGGEVVNTDAMQVYRGMDIGTAKLPVDQRRGIPHHLIDIMDVEEEASVAAFQRLARSRIEDLRSRGAAAILVGGSALYTRAILDRFEFPGTDPVVRRRLNDDLARVGVGEMYARLRAVDPAAAAGIEPANDRRIIRALEVIELTGKPFRARLPEPAYAVQGPVVQVGVDIDRPALDERIAARVRRMLDDGLVEEVRGLPGLAQSPTASRALGYRQLLDHLAGEIDLAEAQRRTVVGTRRFARRQDAWFRKDDRVGWVRYDDRDRLDRALALV